MKKLFGFTAILVGILLVGTTFTQADEAVSNGFTAMTSQPTAMTTPAAKTKKTKKSKKTAKAQSKKAVWVCPMGDFTSDKPGKCPNCGMDLVEKK
jgi:rubrerythrin